jgi:hypothetical protein
MNNTFEYKVRSAAVAGWWVAALGYGLVFLSWFMYLGVMSTRPEWFQCLWGQEVSWSYIQNMWMWGLVIFKLCVWLVILVALWLTVWARQLRKHPGGA